MRTILGAVTSWQICQLKNLHRRSPLDATLVKVNLPRGACDIAQALILSSATRTCTHDTTKQVGLLSLKQKSRTKSHASRQYKGDDT